MAKRSKRQVNRRSFSGSKISATTSAEFDPDYTYIKKDLKRIGILAGSFVVILVALSFIIK